MALQKATNQTSNAQFTEQSMRNAWLYWILANALGHVAGISAFGIVSLFVTWGGSGETGSMLDLALPFALLGLLDGLMVGLTQGLVLQYFTKRPLLGEWALFSGLGGIAAWVLGPTIGGLAIVIIGIMFYVVGGGVAGVVMGFAQRPSALRHLDPQGAWVIPNMIAGALAATVAILFSSLLGGIGGPVEVLILSVGLGGLVYGAVTARPLTRMLDYYVARANAGEEEEPVEDLSKLGHF
ncbi:MAG: hypothetical protein M3437_14265 [Chloroflexota bacterium]|nr:hypothetical protein [Chloroflexota bacterium]MDQ5864578.1 hypothetical protein [Chloroflexota bacterium]